MTINDAALRAPQSRPGTPRPQHDGNQYPSPAQSGNGDNPALPHKRIKREKDIYDVDQGLRRLLRGYAQKVKEEGPEELLMLLDAIKYAGELADDAAQHLHYAERYPWTQMGQALGMSRQAARQRWGIPGREETRTGDGEGR